MNLRTLLTVALACCIVLGCSKREVPSNNETSTDAKTYPSQTAPIVIDGDTADWTTVPMQHTDVEASVPVDLQQLWIAHTEDHLFLRMHLDSALTLQENNSLSLHLDTDDDSSTGRAIHGLGAELTWAFGRRTGTVVKNGDTTKVGHDALGFSSLPTVRAQTFEVAFDRSARLDGQSLFSGNHLRVALTIDGDSLPDAEGGLGYRLPR